MEIIERETVLPTVSHPRVHSMGRMAPLLDRMRFVHPGTMVTAGGGNIAFLKE